MSSFGLYTIGFIVLIAGLAVAAFMVGVPPIWIGIGALVLLGIFIMTGVGKTRERDVNPDGPHRETTTTTTREN